MKLNKSKKLVECLKAHNDLYNLVTKKDKVWNNPRILICQNKEDALLLFNSLIKKSTGLKINESNIDSFINKIMAIYKTVPMSNAAKKSYLKYATDKKDIGETIQLVKIYNAQKHTDRYSQFDMFGKHLEIFSKINFLVQTDCVIVLTLNK